MSNYLFVYGTLKRRSRHPMARRLAQAARHVGAARIAGRLYHLGRFPGLKEPRSALDWVQGDVYDLGENANSILREMDAYENAESPPPTPYKRLPATATLDPGNTLTVWVYWYCGTVAEADFIPSGCFDGDCDPSEPDA
jgi:gamma-glutamylcyclotransferase (GGCT)/AIG2-like uncharacterized protein YtfP